MLWRCCDHLVKLKQWPISCNKKIVCFFWGGVRHIQGWISKKYEGLSQLNLFHMLAHPHLNPSHHQVYFYPRWHPSTHSALYFTYCLCFFLPPLTIVPFFFSFHLPSSAKVQFPPPLLQSPTFPLFMIFHTHVSSFSFALQEHRRRVIYIYVCVWREHVDRGEQQAISGIHIFCSPRSRWEGAQHSRMAFSQSLWNHGFSAFKVEWMCQYVCHCMCMHACVWFPGPYVHV